MDLKSHFVTPKILRFIENFTGNFAGDKTGDNENLKIVKVPCKNSL